MCAPDANGHAKQNTSKQGVRNSHLLVTQSSVQVSAGIRDEAKRHHEVLDRIGTGMGSADGMLRSSVAKFKKVRQPFGPRAAG